MVYYTPKTLRQQLEKAGFTDIKISGGTKMLSVDYVTWHFTTYPVPVITPVLKMIRAVMPGSWARRPWLVRAGGMAAMARKPGGAAGGQSQA